MTALFLQPIFWALDDLTFSLAVKGVLPLWVRILKCPMQRRQCMLLRVCRVAPQGAFFTVE